jgi:glycosyltransferase involved in cell wall biosynthesis
MSKRSSRNSKNSLVFVGNYLDEAILRERLLPAPNPAGSNRMLRLSKAMNANGITPYIVSQASSARIKFNSKIFHPVKITKRDDVVILYASALAIPFLSILYELVSVTFLYLRLTMLRKIKITFLYCYYPSTVLVGLMAKIRGSKIVEDLEDIVTPRWSDWLKTSFLLAIQQSLGLFLMKIALHLSDLIIIPTNRFISEDLQMKNVLVIDGCVGVEPKSTNILDKSKVVVLLAGMLDEEQGIYMFLNMLSLMQNSSISFSKFKFEVCGIAPKDIDLEVRLSEFNLLDIEYYGFVSTAKFNDILFKSDICLALQNPNGRNAMQKTPSKGYEYMAAGKAIIVTRIGNYGTIPPGNLFILEEYSGKALYELLMSLDPEIIKKTGSSAMEYASQNWDFKKVGNRIINSLYK